MPATRWTGHRPTYPPTPEPDALLARIVADGWTVTERALGHETEFDGWEVTAVRGTVRAVVAGPWRAAALTRLCAALQIDAG